MGISPANGPSAVSTQKLFAREAIQMGPHSPSDTNADVCSSLGWVDMQEFDIFACLAMATHLAANSNGITLLEIVAATDTSGDNPTLIKTSGACNTANANLTDYQCLECLAEEVDQIGQAAGLSLRYVAAVLTMDNANSLAAVTYVRSGAKAPHLNLTAPVVG